MARRIPALTMDWSRFEDHRRIRVVGNQHHQPALLGRRVGYLQRGSAKRYNKRVKALEDEGKQPTYPLLIRMQSPGMFQAHLQIPYSSELLKGFKNTKRP